MSLADYLAKNYLSASKSNPTKKRKRKEAKQEKGLVIASSDDDTSTFKTTNNGDDEETPVIVGGGGLHKPTEKTKWVRIGAQAPKHAEQAAADAILADAQAESRAREQQDDDEPTMVATGEDDEQQEGPTMASGAMAGLQTASQVSAALRRKEKAELRAMRAADLASGGLAQQTIYRDASGRMINVKEKRAEAVERALEEEKKQREEVESRKGEVQKREREERKRELQEARVMGVARHADDEKMNAELRERERWDDPMARLLATTKKSSTKGGKSKGGGKSYQGAFEPNRYGIRPGWRWDGVDRSNGFERKWFAARNKKQDREALEYAWQLDE